MPSRSWRADIGDVHLAGTEDGKAAASTLLVLQGFVVSGDPRFDRDGNVVHLDPRQFLARLPDRDVLIDEADVVKQVDAHPQGDVARAAGRGEANTAERSLRRRVSSMRR